MARRMERVEIQRGLAEFVGRAPGSDAERRAAVWLMTRLRASGRGAHLQTVWVRPRWALVHAIHAALAITGTLLTAAVDPAVGLAVLALTVVSMILDPLGIPLARQLTPRRATQNVVSPVPPHGADRPVRLVVCASYDTGPGGLLLRSGPRRLSAALERALGGHGPGPAGVLLGAVALLAVLSAAELLGAGTWTRAVATVPAAVCVVAVFALLDLSPRAGDHGTDSGDHRTDDSAAALAVELTAALDAVAPATLAVELVLLGAGHGPALGARAWVAAQVGAPRDRTIVVNLAGAHAGPPSWWIREGVGLPLRLHPRLTRLTANAASSRPELGARPRASRWPSGAMASRQAGFAAITLGGPPPDLGGTEPAAADALIDLALDLVDAIDDEVGRRAPATDAGGR